MADLQNEIQRVMIKHVRREKPTTVLSAILENEQSMALILQLLRAHVALIKSRSLNINDGQITIYDQALLNLTLNGHDMANTHAVDLFIEEILGLVTVEGMPYGKVSGGIFQSTQKTAAFAADAPQQPLYENTTVVDTSHPGDNATASTSQQAGPSSSGKQVSFANSATEKLFKVVEAAKAEYDAAQYLSNDQRLGPAIFLRDSCENALLYIRNADVDPETILNIKALCAKATADVVNMSDGRKRKFDLKSSDRRGGIPYGNKDWGRKRIGTTSNSERDEERRRGKRGGRRGPRIPPRSFSRDKRFDRRSGSRPPPHIAEETRLQDKQMRAAVKRDRRMHLRNDSDHRRPALYTRAVDSYRPQ